MKKLALAVLLLFPGLATAQVVNCVSPLSAENQPWPACTQPGVIKDGNSEALNLRCEGTVTAGQPLSSCSSTRWVKGKFFTGTQWVLTSYAGWQRVSAVTNTSTNPAHMVAPTPANSVEYVVSGWITPTTYTDGSPLTDLQHYTLQVSTQPNGLFSTVALIPAGYERKVFSWSQGQWWWRMQTVTASGGASSPWGPVVMTMTDYEKSDVPKCWPKPFGSGTFASIKTTETDFAVYWACQTTFSWLNAGWHGRKEMMASDANEQLIKAIPNSNTEFPRLWKTNIKKESGPEYAGSRTLYRQLATEKRPVDPTFVVNPSAVTTNRPTYLVTNGTRSLTPNGRVAVKEPDGTPVKCSCSTLAIGTTTPYCSVAGKTDPVTGGVLPASTVTACVKQ